MSFVSRPHRSMADIRSRPTSARILNLLDLTQKILETPTDDEYQPFFYNKTLNNSIIIKHRIRKDEKGLLKDNKTVGTKLFVPFDYKDLKQGGKYIYIEQKEIEETFVRDFGMSADKNDYGTQRDIRLLKILENLPSLDPFLLREKLRIEGLYPSLDYFQLSDADYEKIRNFIEDEFSHLAAIAIGAETKNERTIDFVNKMWNSTEFSTIEPLMAALRIEEKDYREVMFAWKGFVYYRANLLEISDRFGHFIQELKTIRIDGLSSNPNRDDINKLRVSVLEGLEQDVQNIRSDIRLYESSYFDGLLKSRKPTIFRNFLTNSPRMFQQLGASTGAVKHAMTFWEYHFRDKRNMSCDADDFFDIIRDFASGLDLAGQI